MRSLRIGLSCLVVLGATVHATPSIAETYTWVTTDITNPTIFKPGTTADLTVSSDPVAKFEYDGANNAGLYSGMSAALSGSLTSTSAGGADLTLQFSKPVNSLYFPVAIQNPPTLGDATVTVKAYLGSTVVPITPIFGTLISRAGMDQNFDESSLTVGGAVFDKLVIEPRFPDDSNAELFVGAIDVTVAEPIEIIEGLQSKVSNPLNDIEASFRAHLLSKLADAHASVVALNDPAGARAALIDLRWVVQQVGVQSPKKLSDVLAEEIIHDATVAIDLINALFP